MFSNLCIWPEDWAHYPSELRKAWDRAWNEYLREGYEEHLQIMAERNAKIEARDRAIREADMEDRKMGEFW